MATSVLRLTFSITQGAARLTDQRRVEMTLPPSDPVAEYHGRAGHWFEVQDATGTPLYGQRMVDPMPTGHEVFGPDRAARWVARRRPASTFEVLAPLMPGAATVVLFSSSGGKDRTAAAKEIARVDLRGMIR
jgi:hypothetical protein